MSRYIDADALKKRVSELIVPDWTRTLIRSWLDSEPTVDAVPVTRCAQCKWCDYPVPNSTKYGCRLFDRCVKGDWFCADGERRTV